MARFKLKFKPHWLNGVLRISTMMLKHLNMVLEEEGPSSSAAGENVSEAREIHSPATSLDPTSNTFSRLSTSQVIDVIEPTFHLKPEEKCKFYPSQAKKIAQEILEEELAGKVSAKCHCVSETSAQTHSRLFLVFASHTRLATNG